MGRFFNFGKHEFIRDYVQFRLVELDDYNNVVKVHYLSKEYEPTDQFGREFSDDHYKVMMEFDNVFNYVDYDNVPPLEFQARRKGKDEWLYLSDPVDDFFNT